MNPTSFFRFCLFLRFSLLSSLVLSNRQWKHMYSFFFKKNRLYSSVSDFLFYKDILDLSSNQIAKLEELKKLLVNWNEKVNLISRKDIKDIIPNHILPSLAIHSFRKFHSNETVIDVGTGGGLPGLPMAIANPDTQFTLLDSNSKKMKIVQNMVDIMNLNNVIVVCCRAEEHQGEYNFIIGRGVSAIPNFLTYSSHLLKSSSPVESPKLVTSGLLYLKGGDFTEELEAINISKNDIIMTPVKELLPGLNSEKFVLYIPAIPIHEFNRNLVMRLSTETNNRNFKSSKKI